MTVIREGSSSYGDVIAVLEGDEVFEGDSTFGGVVVRIDGDFIRDGRDWSNNVLANLSGSTIYKGRWHEVLCRIDGDEIVEDWGSSAMFSIDGEASDIEKAGLAVAALILTGGYDETISDADTSEVKDPDSEQLDLDGSDSSEESDYEDASDWDSSPTARPGAPRYNKATSTSVQASSAPTENDNSRAGCALLLVIIVLVGGYIFWHSDIRQDTAKTVHRTQPKTTKSTPAVSSRTLPGETETKMLERAHSEIDHVYKTVMASLDPNQQEELRQEQREWIKWRDAQADRLARTFPAGPNSYSVDHEKAMITLLGERTRYLENYKQAQQSISEKHQDLLSPQTQHGASPIRVRALGMKKLSALRKLMRKSVRPTSLQWRH